jgi:hypothetical protein
MSMPLFNWCDPDNGEADRRRRATRASRDRFNRDIAQVVRTGSPDLLSTPGRVVEAVIAVQWKEKPGNSNP